MRRIRRRRQLRTATSNAHHTGISTTTTIVQIDENHLFYLMARGIPVARLIPATRPSREDIVRAVEELEEFQTGVRLNPPGTDRLTVRQLTDEGRKW